MYVDPDGHFAVVIPAAAYAALVAVLGAALVYYAIKTIEAIVPLINQSFARVKSRPNYRSRYELHHIVAQTAAPVRNI
jgi:hypothetical protein